MVKSAACASVVVFGLLVVACGGGDGSSAANTANSDGGAGTSSGANATVKTTCVSEINKYRATLGLAAYTEWSDGETCADGEAKSDSESAKAHGAFGTCQESAQDECPGWPGADLDTSIKGCLQQMWAEGPGTDFSTHGHYLNMSNSTYTSAACGFYVTPDGKLWAVQNFK